jgi:hypothetical protein
VTAIGIASVIHQEAIRNATASVRHATGSSVSGAGMIKMIINPISPNHKPINCLVEKVLKKYPV